MKHLFYTLGAIFLALGQAVAAEVQPVEQLMPNNTILLFSAPDLEKVKNYYKTSPYGKLWADPAMKAFRDKIATRWGEDIVKPLERELSLKFSDYTQLFSGQISLGLTTSGNTSEDKRYDFILVADAKGKSGELKSKLAELKKKWVDAGKQIQTETIREIEMNTLVFSDEDWDALWKKAFPDSNKDSDEKQKDNENKKNETHKITIAQSGSLLLISENIKELEKIVARQSGAGSPPIADQAAFQKNSALFRESLAFGWINFQPFYQEIEKEIKTAFSSQEQALPLKVDRLLANVGLAGLQTISFKFAAGPEGTFGESFVALPEATRKGIFKIFWPEARDSGPPEFVPADVVKFSRWRIDGPKAWGELESMITSAAPELAGLLQLTLSALGKDKDPNFDMKKSFIANIGNDFICYEKNPGKPEEAANRELFLIGSPNLDQFASAFKTVTSILPGALGSAPLKEREFLGKKVFSLEVPTQPGGESDPGLASLHFATSSGYLAISKHPELVEEFLRGAESRGRSLKEVPTLAEAVQKTGGYNTGWFAYENQLQGMKSGWDRLREDQAGFLQWLELRNRGKNDPEESEKKIKEWLDFSLLPSFDKVAKYFHYSVFTVQPGAEGLTIRGFAPTPPGVR